MNFYNNENTQAYQYEIEKRAKEKGIVFCRDCKYKGSTHRYFSVDLCLASPKPIGFDYVKGYTNEMSRGYEFCKLANKDGHCSMFERREKSQARKCIF